MNDVLREAREAFARRDWSRAFDGFAVAAGDLGGDDLFRQADAAWWLGRIDDALRLYERSVHALVADGRVQRAALAALLLGAHAMECGEEAVGSGWMNRARRLLADAPEGAEHGYPLYWDIFAALGRGELDRAGELAEQMQLLGRRHDDRNLVAVGVMAEGRVHVKRAAVARGMELLDEAMVMVVSDDLHPLWTGAIYCHLMDVCHELQDLERAARWTDATARWCDAVGEAVVYRGICRVHRAQVFQRQGAWARAEDEARRAGEALPRVHVGTGAEAHYELGEIHRLRGDLDRAEESYRQAHRLGRTPQPGLALLRAAQGAADAACVSLRTALAERTGHALERVPLCAALVDVAVAVGEVEAARAACAELRQTAGTFESPGLQATARQAHGALLLADGEPTAALADLHAACRNWHDLEAPHEAARTRLLRARAHQSLGDVDAALLDLDAAESTFTSLGATAAVRETEVLRDAIVGRPAAPPDGLSPREVEILRLVARGLTNRQIADELTISDKTVARHVANVYLKIHVGTRAAATAYAFDHDLAG